MSQTNGEWIQAIAGRATIDSSRVESILAAHHISPAPVLPSPRRLLLIQIAFSGAKDKAGVEEPFSFDWSDLNYGLWAVLSDQNFRGKSSILEVVHWLLRGRPTSNLQMTFDAGFIERIFVSCQTTSNMRYLSIPEANFVDLWFAAAKAAIEFHWPNSNLKMNLKL